MSFLRAFAGWLLIIFAESVHGTLRQFFLVSLVGDFPARRIAVFTGMILIFGVTYFCISWIDAPTRNALFAIGLMWIFLTVLFEFSLGIFDLDYSWGRMFED